MGITALLSGLALSAAAADKSPAPRKLTSQQEAFFENHVRPVLATKCLDCHGPRQQKGGLRLDSFAALNKGADSGPVIEAGDPNASRLIEVITYDDPIKMPPQGKLSSSEIAALSNWIKMGTPFPDKPVVLPPSSGTLSRVAELRQSHWSFRPIQNPPLPEVSQSNWCRNDLDWFVLAKLEANGLTPSAAADKRTLLRRASFDLTGLPPTAQELTAFEADSSPDAFAKVVDRLLASPRYGERWGRFWLDVARYADTKGYVFFEDPLFHWAYTYRDYVVRAFNNDLPFNRFILEQIAADQLDLGSDPRPLAALGFLSLGGKFMNNPHDVADDRIDVVTRGFLGLTVQCARCHDHKYDPISTADYYGLYGIFRSSSEPAVLPKVSWRIPENEEYEQFEQELAARKAKLESFIDSKHEQLCREGRTKAADYLNYYYISRDQPSVEDFMQVVPEGELNPTMQVRWWVYLDKYRKQHHPVWAAWHELCRVPEKNFATGSADALKRLANSATPAKPLNPLVLQALREKPLVNHKGVAERFSALLARIEEKWQQQIAAAAKAKQPVPSGLADPHEEQLRQVFHGPQAPPDMPRQSGWGILSLLPDRASQGVYQELLKSIEKWCVDGPQAPERAHVLTDSAQPFEPHILVRGNPNRHGPRVARQFLEILRDKSIPYSQGSGRLELARNIADPKNPLTARVYVNRVWLNHFGKGLVQTPGDFGLRSEAPSHPELLDWLATSFMQNGWSTKKLHRLILLSATWQQQSADRDDCRLADSENRLLWKMNRRRLDFEGLRDSLLATAGTLDRRIGGPPGKLDDQRSTIYSQVDRMNLPGLFRTFDFPSPEGLSPQRDNTTVPPQALFLMNNKFATQAAHHLVGRPEVAGKTDTLAKLDALYQLTFTRKPTRREKSLSLTYLGDQPSLEAWANLAQALLMTNEFAFVD